MVGVHCSTASNNGVVNLLLLCEDYDMNLMPSMEQRLWGYPSRKQSSISSENANIVKEEVKGTLQCFPAGNFLSSSIWQARRNVVPDFRISRLFQSMGMALITMVMTIVRIWMELAVKQTSSSS